MKNGSVKDADPKQKANAKRAITIMLLCILFLAVYFTVMSFEIASGYKTSVIMQVYAYADAVLLFAFLILNLGFTSGKMTADMFSSELSREQAERRAKAINRNKDIARNLLYLIIPITFTLFADVLLLFWGDKLSAMLQGLTSVFK